MEFAVLTRFFRFMPVEAHARLNDELRARGHKMLVVRPPEVRLKVNAQGTPTVNFLNQNWRRIDLLIPLLRWNDDYGWTVNEAIQRTGQQVLRSPRLPQGDRNAMLKLYQENDLIVPESFLINRSQVWSKQRELPWPLQLQARLGQTGRLQKTVANWNELDDVLQEYEQIIEEPLYLREAGSLQGSVISVLVIGDRAVSNLERPDGLRDIKPGRPVVSALYRDKFKPGKLSAADELAVVKTRRMYGVTHAVVDIKQTPQGPLILDVNTAPNLAWFERMSGLNLVGKVVEFWEQLARALQERR